MSKRAIGRPWTVHEDELLANAVAVHGEVDSWKTVALSVPGRTNKACRKRWLHSLSPSVKKTAWTKDEDDLLLELYQIHAAKWAIIARNIPGRTDDACAKRYREALDPSLKKDEWTTDEDERLLAAYARLGGQWGRVGQELQRSGLGCRNRWRLLQRKRQQDFSPPLPAWSVPMIDYWDSTHDIFAQYATSQYEKDALVFAPFDYESSPSAVGSTSPASYSDDMHQCIPYSDCPHQFQQLQRTLPHTAIPSVHPVQVDHYTAPLPHAECSLSHAPLATTPQSTSVSVQNTAEAYFASSEQQASHMTAVPLLDHPDPYFHVSPQQPIDVNPQHPPLHTPDPLSLSESHPGYHYAHHPVPSRARVVETMHGPEQHAEYLHNHVQQDQSHLTQAVSSSPRYALQQPELPNVHTPPQPEAGPSRTPPNHYYPPDRLLSSQPLRRSTASPRSAGMPYPTRPSSSDTSSINSEDYLPPSLQPVPKRKLGGPVSRKRPDTQTPLRLSSDLQATPDSSVKPYACGHESCWPSNAASSRACYCTSRGLSDHNKTAHPEDSGGDRPYRCGLEGCGKSWKSINGLQYHLQISKAHFQHAITSSFVSSYISDLAVPASVEASTSAEGEDKTRKQYKCPHENCPNRYKQLSGLRYHLAHGHPVDLPKQLDLVPPALSRKLAEKMRVQGSGTTSASERQVRGNSSEASIHCPQGSFNT